MAKKYEDKAQESVKDAMHKKVTDKKQEIAIELSEARKKGAKIPKKKTG